MISTSLLLCGLWTAVQSAGPSDVPPSPAPPSPPAKTALIVAISDYPDDLAQRFRMQDLPGAANDPDRVRELLVDRFGFPADEVFVLRDGAATHEAVVRAFHDRLIARAGPDTEAVFWFSGHGSRVPDASGIVGAEPDGLDSTLVCVDSRSEGRDGSYDLTDDELGALVGALSLRTTRITVVTDSCYSGGATRGAGGRVRTTAFGARPLDLALIESFWPEGVPVPEDRPALEQGAMKHVHVHACAPEQQAREWEVGGKVYGGLTYFLTGVLWRANPDDSYRTVVEMAAAQLRSHPDFRDQSIGVVGDVDRRVFGSGFAAPPRGYRARVVGRNRVRIEAGFLQGICDRSQFDVTRLSDGEEMGRVEIMDLQPGIAFAVWKGGVPGDVSGAALIVVEAKRPGGWAELDVHCGHPALSARLATIDGVRLVDAAVATYRVEIEPADASPDGPARVRFVDVAGARIWPGPTDDVARDDWIDEFGSRFESQLLPYERKYRDTLALVNVGGTLKMEAAFVPLEPRDLHGYDRSDGSRGRWSEEVVLLEAVIVPRAVESRGVGVWEYLARVEPDSGAGPMRLARIDVTNPTARDAYVSILSVPETRDTKVVWPPAGDGAFEIPAGATRSAFVTLNLPTSFGHERPMLDRYLIIATREPTTFDSLEQESILRGPGPSPAAVAGAALVLAPDESCGVSWLDVLVSASDAVGSVPPALREANRLDPYYRKYVAAAGFPILGSERVSDAALREAAWIVRQMLAGRKDVLAALTANGVHLTVMAFDEYTTDVPEHRELAPRVYWDRRARGLGGSPVSCAEENLLGFPGDPYATENILIHEFAHIVHAEGVGSLDPTFDVRLERAFDAAIAGGLWAGTYAATNREEYWAEGVQSWFDDNRQGDALHNHVDTRDELREYDAGLAALCKEVFGDRAWRYVKPAERDAAGRAHLGSYDFEAAPRFAWRDEPVPGTPRVSIQTALGNIELELDRERAPELVREFLVDVHRGNYSDGSFHVAAPFDGLELRPVPTQAAPGPTRPRFVLRGGDESPVEFGCADPPSSPGFTPLGRVVEGGELVRRLRSTAAAVAAGATEGAVDFPPRIQRAIRMN